MKKLLFLLIAMLCGTAMSFGAESASALLGRVAAKLKAQKSIVAQYALTADGHTQRGTLVASGNQFLLTSPEVSVWYDGKTQWTYSPQIGEVNITEPEADEVAQINPFAIINAFQKHYNATYSGKKVLLTARSRAGDIRTVLFGVNPTTLMPTEAVVTLSSGQKIKITITSIKDGGPTRKDAFTYKPSLLPRGVRVIDLR